LWLPVTIASGILFIGIGLTMGVPNEALLFVVPAVALITWLNARAMKFCDSCGGTVYSQNPFAQQKFCSKCGAKFD
jgi:NADH pyrophosphatase NudC (nudix superfamily)